jgi:cell division control protein 45
LKADGIQYQVIPVADYTELGVQIQKLNETAESLQLRSANASYAAQSVSFRNMILLGCGSYFDFTSTWISSQNFPVYVIDSNRPFSKSNIDSPHILLISEHFQPSAVQPEQDEAEEEEEEPVPQIGSKRRAPPTVPTKRFKSELEQGGHFFGISTAGMFYELARQLNRETSSLLWLWAVGLADQLIHGRIERSRYEAQIQELTPFVIKYNPSPFYNFLVLEDDGKQRPTEHLDVGTLCIDDHELRLMLLRHWTLYDSLIYSDYTAAKLCSWKEPGRRRLRELLAQLGIKLRLAKQDFKYVGLEVKKNLRDRIQRVVDEFELGDMFTSNVIRQFTGSQQFTAADTAYAVTALAESPTVLTFDEESTSVSVYSREVWLENFWVAYEALLSADLIEQGIKMAISQQQAIISLGTELLDKRIVNPARKFRYAVITTDLRDQIKFFHFPCALKRLARFILDAYSQQNVRHAPLPIVISVKNSARQTYFVTAVMPPASTRK